MLLTPRYHGPPLLVFARPVADVATPFLRQRRRLVDLVAGLDDEQWGVPTRCDAWTVKDVVTHLVSVDAFWALAAASALTGEPTRYLTTFDPTTTPEQLVAGERHHPAAAVLERFRDGVEQLAAVLGNLEAEAWDLPAEAPPGHIPLHAMAAHGLWDAWIHERDIAVPLGLLTAEEPDELAVALRYAALLGPAFAAGAAQPRAGTLLVEATDLAITIRIDHGQTVTVTDDPKHVPDGAVVLRGRTVDLIEALSFRARSPTRSPPRTSGPSAPWARCSTRSDRRPVGRSAPPVQHRRQPARGPRRLEPQGRFEQGDDWRRPCVPQAHDQA